MRCPQAARRRAGEAVASVREWWTASRSRCKLNQPVLSPPFSGSGDGRVGISPPGSYLRGFLDLLGTRWGRRHPVELRAADPLDGWGVEAWEGHRLLPLWAEMKAPGRAWLQFEVEPAERGSRITQTAVFDPLGLSGLLYWYGLYPIRWLIFQRMLRRTAEA